MQKLFGTNLKQGQHMPKYLLYTLTLFLPSLLYAHTLLLNVFDNEDNTITVEGVFNTGQNAAGAQVRLESLMDGKILYKKRLPDDSELTLDIPKEPYQVVLDGGPGHQIIQEGIAPKEGFDTKVTSKTKEVKLSEPRNKTQLPIEMIISIAVAFVLLFITILISIFNTRKLMSVLKKSTH
jgi:hypothetical protein